MSTKFSGIAKTQKAPAVCKKPPPPDVVPIPPFTEREIQGYVEWIDPGGSDDVAVSGFLTMTPEPSANLWTGTTPGGPYAVRVEMIYQEPMEAYDFTVTLILNGSFVTAFQQLLVPPRQADPFDSGVIILTPEAGQARVMCRIMS